MTADETKPFTARNAADPSAREADAPHDRKGAASGLSESDLALYQEAMGEDFEGIDDLTDAVKPSGATASTPRDEVTSPAAPAVSARAVTAEDTTHTVMGTPVRPAQQDTHAPASPEEPHVSERAVRTTAMGDAVDAHTVARHSATVADAPSRGGAVDTQVVSESAPATVSEDAATSTKSAPAPTLADKLRREAAVNTADGLPPHAREVRTEVVDRPADAATTDTAVLDDTTELTGATARGAATEGVGRRTVEIDRTQPRPLAAEVAADDRIETINDEPLPPKKRGNRVFGLLMHLFTTLVFGLLLALALQAAEGVNVLGADFWGRLADVVFHPFVWVPTVAFFLFGVLWALLVNRAGWWAYILGALLAGLVATAAQPLAGMIKDYAPYTGEVWLGHLLHPGALVRLLITFIVANQVMTWLGGLSAWRGRHLRVKHARATEEYEADMAERRKAERMRERMSSSSDRGVITDEASPVASSF